MTFDNFFLESAYKRVQKLGDPLTEFDKLIDWEAFRPIIAKVFRDGSEKGGRPHTDEVVIIKILFLQALYNLSDPQLEYQLSDRLSFRHFTGIGEDVPDFTTIWRIRDRLRKEGVEEEIWEELQRQIEGLGFTIKRGVIQDATIIHRSPGRRRGGGNKGGGIKSEKRSSQIDHDASYTKKHGKIYFGYKDHVKVDVDHHLVRKYCVTTASVHDSRVDLVEVGDVAAYRDKGYFGVPLKAEGVIDKTMKRAVRGRRLNGGEQRRNRHISRIRAPVERVFSVVKRVFNGWYTEAKSLERVSIREMFKFFAYNLYQLRSLHRKVLA